MTDAVDPLARPAQGPATGGAALSPPREGPYAPIAPGSRVTYAWATPITQLVIYVLSVIPAIIAVVVVVIPISISTGVTVTGDVIPPELELPALIALVVVQFPAWALLIFLWVRGFERRSLASIGLCGPSVLRRYAVGLAVGAAVAVVLGVLSPFAAPETAVAETLDFDLTRVLRAEWLLMIGAMAAFFLVQGAAEEVACRGWMLSAVAARRGVMAGVLANTAAFAALHVHVFRSDLTEVVMIFLCILITLTFAGWLGRRGLIGGLVVSALLLAITPWSLTPQDLAFGLVAMTAIGCVGLFLSLWAVQQRSIVGVCGIHGAFNATIMIMSIVAIAATTPDATPQSVLLQTVREATGQGAETSVGGVLLQLALFGGLSALIWSRLRSSRPDFR
jgi:membrane protease YdiL (CAAX protease family)